MEPLLYSAALLTQLHDRADVFLRQVHGRGDDRLLDRFVLALIGDLRRVVELDDLAAVHLHAIAHARRRRDEVQVELALESFLDDLHVEQAEKPGTEAKTERR